MNLFVKIMFAVLQKGHKQRCQKSHNGWHGVKITSNNTGSQKDNQKNTDGKERRSPSSVFFHKTPPLIV